MGPTGYDTAGVHVDEEFVPEVLSFQKECQVEIKALSLRWGPTRTIEEPDRVGYCIPTTLPRIRITRTIQGMPSQAFRLLVYHELGHCILGLDHTDAPDEIMSAYFDASKDSYFRANWHILVNNFCGDKR